MPNEKLSLICSFIALIFAVLSYFVKKKQFFLICQGGSIIFLMLTTFFDMNYFVSLSYLLSITRVITYYVIEQKTGKASPFFVMMIFAVLVVIVFIILSVVNGYKPIDLLSLTGSVIYVFLFAIRDMQTLRALFVIPTIMFIVYFIITTGPIFTIISYSFELIATVVAFTLTRVRQRRFLRIEFPKKGNKKES